MKRLLSFLLCILFASNGLFAADPFRSHRYDVFKVLPLNEQNIVFVGNSITNMHEWWEAFGCEGNIVNRGVWGTFIGETVAYDLAGRKVTDPVKGIYIVDGVKLVVK